MMNHAFGPEPFNAYQTMRARTLCRVKYESLEDDETMTSSRMVTCLRCIVIRAGLSKRE